jgi:hypothetical protein
VFPTDRLDTLDTAAVREYAARYPVPIIRRWHVFGLSLTCISL